MYAFPGTHDDLSAPIVSLSVTVVTLASSATTQAIVQQLRRESMVVEVALLDVIEVPAKARVYIVSVGAVGVAEVAPRFVEWAARSDPRAGLIGVVEDGATVDSEALLAAGFDDAVNTPVSAREMVARVRALHRRVHRKGIPNGRLQYGELTLDLYVRELWIDGKIVPLTSIELAVVRVLINARGRPLSRADLLDLAWGEAVLEVSERAVDNVILRLRRKLPRPDLIETVRSVGFRITFDRVR